VLTIFTIPKAFWGHVGVIQRNAIQSWKRLHPEIEIILFGGEEGTAQAAGEAGAQHLREVAVNEHGTPLLNDVFRQAEKAARGELLCYANADILLPGAFAEGVTLARKAFGKFLMVSRRVNVDVTEPLAFAEGWERKLRSQSTAALGDYTAIDVFVFSKGTYREMPPFAIGRLWFDQWLIKSAREQGWPVVDASRIAPVLHQNHDYNHVAGGAERVWRGSEAKRNFALYGGVRHGHTLLDATHEITREGGLRRIWLRRTLTTIRELGWEVFVRRTVRIRHALKLRRRFWRRSGMGAGNERIKA
jgi:hypothetical protein